MTMEPATSIRVDDDGLVRDGIAAILDGQPSLTVVGRGSTGQDAISLCREIAPDVLLLDIQMPGTNGLDALAEIRRTAPGVAVVMLTTFDTDAYIDQALAHGAAGFLLKNSSYEDLVTAVRSAHSGAIALSPSITDRVVSGYVASRTTPNPDDVARIAALTDREREILRLLATGASNLAIAATLHLSEHTVKTHVSHILAKTGCEDRTQAAVLAHRLGHAD
jgi:DNA-binding NarL/FixJ family response regulator